MNEKYEPDPLALGLAISNAIATAVYGPCVEWRAITAVCPRCGAGVERFPCWSCGYPGALPGGGAR